MKKIITLSAILATVVMTLINTTSYAQQGQTGIGLRLGYHPGITIKHFVRDNGAIEGIIHTGYRGLLFTGLYEWHKGFSESPALKLYGGIGAHIGVFDRYYGHHHHHHDADFYHDGHGRASFGGDVILGLGYDFTDIPLNLSLDVKPAVDFYYGHAHTYMDGALSVRVLF